MGENTGTVQSPLTSDILPGQPHEKTEEICYNLPKGDGQL